MTSVSHCLCYGPMAYGCIPAPWVAKHPDRAEVERHHVEVYSESIWTWQVNGINLNILFVSSAKNYEISVCNKIRYRKSTPRSVLVVSQFHVASLFAQKSQLRRFCRVFLEVKGAAAELHQKHPLLKEVLPPLLQEKSLLYQLYMWLYLL